MKKAISITIILILLVSFIPLTTYAATFSVSSSTSSIVKGNSFTITINGEQVTGRFNISASSNITLLQSYVWVENNSKTISATANSSGNGTITVTAINVSDNEGNDVEGSKTISITVTDPTPVPDDPSVVDQVTTVPPTTTTKPTPAKKEEVKKSSDATLKELIVAEGAILPEFNQDVKDYTLSVPNEITTLNITATQNHSKATVKVEGNTDLKVGENKVTITVIAEDGITNIYTINVTREKLNVTLATLKITYIDSEGNTKELILNPTFDPSVLEYNIDEAISYLINSLKVEAISSIEGATVEITGNENLVAGQNEITIVVTVKAEQALEGEEQLPDEVATYKINLTKQQEPTLWQKIKNWFGGIAGTIGTFYNNNQNKINFGAIALCIVALLGLSIYIVIDFKKYKILVEKLKKVGELNNSEMEPEMVGFVEAPAKELDNNSNVQKTENNKNVEEENNNEIEEKPKEKSGKHF